MSTNLIQDATNHLNGRSRGRDARLARLAAGGVPTDTAGMREWLQSTLDADLETRGGIYHACTVRIANGADPDLPTKGKVGCRITRIPIDAERIEKGEVIDTITHSDGVFPLSFRHVHIEDDSETEGVVADEPLFVVRWGCVGTGYTAPTYDSISSTCEEAEERARAALLERGDCFTTRAAALAAVTKMLHSRAR